MKNLTTILVVIIILFLKATILLADTRIYVDPRLGNDGNNGRDIDHPLQTIYKAGLICHGGDTIFIRGGLPYTNFYDEFYQVDTLGLIPVWIMPYFNESVILDGVGHTFLDYEAVLNIQHARNVVIENLHVRNNLNGGAGIRVVSNYPPLFITRDVIVRNCLVHDTYRQGILVQANNVTIENCEIYNAVMRNEKEKLGTTGWDVALGTFHWPDPIDYWTNIVFKNNIVHNSWGEGIVALRCENFTIENNHVYDCYSAYIYVDNSRKGVIRNNWVHSTNDTYNRQYRPDFRAPGSGIIWAAEQNFAHYGVDSLVSDLDIYNNLIVRTNTPISWWRDINNTFPNNSYENINVYYNTIYLAFAIQAFHLDPNTSGVYTPTNCNFKNNIICKGQYPLGTTHTYFTTSSHYKSWNIDYNCFIDGDIPSPIPISHNIEGTPSFVDPTNLYVDTSFRIRANSNCRHKAIPIDELEKDYWNALRDNNMPCIGIHEYGGTSGSGQIENELPGNYYLGQNFPNPFNPVSLIQFGLKRNAHVSLTVYDIFGRELTRLVDSEFREANDYKVKFDGTNYSSGIYFYRLTADNFAQSKKMLLVK